MMSDGDERSCQKTMEELGRLSGKILQRIKRCLLQAANCVPFVGASVWRLCTFHNLQHRRSMPARKAKRRQKERGFEVLSAELFLHHLRCADRKRNRRHRGWHRCRLW